MLSLDRNLALALFAAIARHLFGFDVGAYALIGETAGQTALASTSASGLELKHFVFDAISNGMPRAATSTLASVFLATLAEELDP